MTGSAPAPRPGGGSAARLGRPGGRRTHRVGRRLPAPCPHAGATAASGGAGPARRTDDGGGALAGASVAPDAARGRWEPGGRIAAGGGGGLRSACVGGARPGTHRRCGRRTGRPRRPGGLRRTAARPGTGGRPDVDPSPCQRQAALLDAMSEAVLAEVATVPDGDGPSDWEEVARRTAHEYRAMAYRHPRIFPLLVTRAQTSPVAVSALERPAAAMRAAGLPDRTVADAPLVLFGFLDGHLLARTIEEPGAMPAFDATAYPAMAALAPAHNRLRFPGGVRPDARHRAGRNRRSAPNRRPVRRRARQPRPGRRTHPSSSSTRWPPHWTRATRRRCTRASSG
ncbi:TetR/AcrR family transcriptional regulator C-terminal domain-containing protein [Streptomyces diastaticus]|uniref:TetR/AcrR family transcriptional regulator C-terminal domain-containing protein n=2 Tax=Streptomyces diastaticus TaxID=1956 RepID=UPI0036554A83